MISKTIKNEIKAIMRQLPKELDWEHPEHFTTYELMIYINQENRDFDFDEFSHFKGLTNLDKVIKKIIKDYGETLNHIDFKWSYEEGEFDQMTIYTRV